jgi:hypothetical protein
MLAELFVAFQLSAHPGVIALQALEVRSRPRSGQRASFGARSSLLPHS